jgi:hypothetical protein
MKKSLIVLFAAFSLITQAQEQKTWRIGITLGNAGNKSVYTGGTSTANARFAKEKWGSGSFGINARYDLDKRWMINAGIGVHSIGFGYSIAQNYSLMRPDSRNRSIKSDFGVIEMPAMVFYKFNPNCKNAKWLIGAGFSQDFIGKQTINKSMNESAEGGSSTDYISSTSATKGGLYWNFRWSVAREKTFKNNSILNAAVLFNIGMNQVATSTVNYTIDNQTYTHEFSNKGSFVGLRLTYFFKPVAGPAQKAAKAAKTSTLGK